MRLRAALASVLVFALAGCAGDGRPAAAPRPPATETGPIALIGLWTVEGTDEQAGTVLRIAPEKQLSLWRSCGMLSGSWAAQGALFLATLDGGSGDCLPAGSADATPAWLKRATGYRSTGGDQMLVDDAGNTVARLLPGGRPKVTGGVAASEAEPPAITDEDRAKLETTAAPLPAGTTAAQRSSLLGRWVPASGGAAAFVAFNGDGTWTGSDGCNGNGGRWTVGADGVFLATAGPSTLMACDGAPVPTWLSTATLAGASADQLVLLDTTGTEVGRLRKG
jgi:heat shock protein HslJ